MPMLLFVNCCYFFNPSSKERGIILKNVNLNIVHICIHMFVRTMYICPRAKHMKKHLGVYKWQSISSSGSDHQPKRLNTGSKCTCSMGLIKMRQETDENKSTLYWMQQMKKIWEQSKIILNATNRKNNSFV